MVKNQKYIFLQALIITFIVFNIGIYMGYKLEQSRTNKINDWYLEADLELLNLNLQKEAFELIDLNCDALIEENTKFADEIYEKALIIDKYEKASRISDDVIYQHKRFDLLRALFWMNSIKIKEKCSSSYHNVVYFYQYNDASLDQKSKQRVFSKILSDLKQEFGSDVMLIPLAADNDLSAINILVDKYEIQELPTILIDETTKLNDISSLEDIKKFLD